MTELAREEDTMRVGKIAAAQVALGLLITG